MAITPNDFSKIWASNADTPEYTFNEADYLKGWDFVGNLPPTRAQWNAMQKSTDEKMKYVFDNFGAPLLANTVAEMTMQNRVYVYTGSETGYTAGHWYYWNGSAWTDGGVYNAVVVQTDATLTQAGVPADAKATGDAISVKADTSIVPVVDPTLTISGAAADAEVVGDKFTEIYNVSYSKNLFNPAEKLDGYYLNAGTGALTEYTDRSVTGYMPVTSGKILVCSKDLEGVRTRDSMAAVCCYNADKQAVTGGGTWVATLTIPIGVAFVRVCMPTSHLTYDFQAELTDDGNITDYVPYSKTVSLQSDVVVDVDQIDGLDEYITPTEDAVDSISVTEQYLEPYFSVYLNPYYDGYVDVDGVFHSYTALSHTDKIPVKPGYVLTGVTTDHTDTVLLRFVTAFSGDIVVPSKGSGADCGTYTVPEGIDGVVVSQRNVNVGKVRSIEIRGFDNINATNLKNNPLGYMRDSGDMSDGDILAVSENNVKNNVVVTFNANITSFDTIYVGQRTANGSSMGSCYLEINATNLIIHTAQGNTTIAHGLTIANDIQVLIETATDVTTSHIRIGSSGYYFDETNPHRWLCDEGYACAVSVNSTLTDCVLSWTSRNLNKPIWLFGDSYISLYDARWINWLIKDGFDKSCLINGYAGEQSTAGMTALKNLLTCCIPKYVVWILGMNNADSDSAVNTSWKANYDLMINLCKKHNIIPILATIPNTPTVNHRFKNDIVRNSGYRYIDFDKAVEPSGDGTWISGALSSDNVHPTATGAKILYMKALADLPELTSL